MSKPKAIAVVGPTSSGKTSLSIAIAKKFSGEIISADSRQVYKDLDLGTGKVTVEEMDGVPHHLLDVADPSSQYNAAEFELDATTAILGIQSRGHLPIIAGGTFFYLDMLRGKHKVPEVPPNDSFRLKLASLTNEELFEELEKLDHSRAETIDRHNRPRLIRALEIIDTLGHVPKVKQTDSPYDWLVIGIDIDKLKLHQHIHKRLIDRFDAGMVDEVQNLHKNGLSYERMHELGLEYRYIAMYLQQEILYPEMFEKLETKTRQYAKRQMTWLRRDKEIEWFKPEDETGIFALVEEFLHDTNG